MGEAWIDGAPVTLQAAIAQAARLLNTSRMPVIAGLGTDVAGARAAVALAERVGAAIDHMHAGALLHSLDVLREARMLQTTPHEARLRADTLLLLGAEPVAAWPRLSQLLTQPLGPQAEGAARRVLWLCPGGAAPEAQDAGAHIIGRDPADLPAALAVLRARLAGRRIDRIGVAEKVIDDLAAELRAAHFGVAVWAAAELGSLATEMLGGIIDDLNESTRFSGLCLGPADNATGVLQVCGWMTALPMRTGFGRGRPEHDPWRFDAARLVESGEADCALWISAYRAAGPQWRRPVPTIALTGAEAEWPSPPRVQIDVGRPGFDHDAVEHMMAAATLAAVPAATPSDRMPVARVLAEIAAALPGGAARGAPPC